MQMHCYMAYTGVQDLMQGSKGRISAKDWTACGVPATKTGAETKRDPEGCVKF